MGHAPDLLTSESLVSTRTNRLVRILAWVRHGSWALACRDRRCPGGQVAESAEHKTDSTFRSAGNRMKRIPAAGRGLTPTAVLLAGLYIGFGVLGVLNETLARMHMPGGPSATGASLKSLNSATASGPAGEAFNQWVAWSNQNSESITKAGSDAGLPIIYTIALYAAFDLILISLPVFFLIRRMLEAAADRLVQYGGTAGNGVTDSDELSVDDLKSRQVRGLGELKRLSSIVMFIYLAAGLVANLLLMWAAFARSPDPKRFMVATGIASTIEVVALLSALMGLAVVLVGPRAMRADPEVGVPIAVQAARKTRNFILALRVQILLGVALLSFAMLPGELGHQLDDAFLRPFGGEGYARGILAFVALAILLVVAFMVTANLCLRAYVPGGEDSKDPPRFGAVVRITSGATVGAALTIIGLIASQSAWRLGTCLIAPGIVILVLTVYSAFTRSEVKPQLISNDRNDNWKFGWSIAILAAYTPLLVFTALAVRNGVRLLTIHEGAYGLLLILASPVCAVLVGCLLTKATKFCLIRLGWIAQDRSCSHHDSDGRPPTLYFAILTALSVLALAVASARPLVTGAWIGSWGAVYLFFLIALLLGTALVIAGDRLRTWGLLETIGFRRTPLILILLVCLAINTVVDQESVYHDTRLGSETPTAAERLSLTEALNQWAAAQRMPVGGNSDLPPNRRVVEGRTEVPLVFVASSGGGIRAAYWTALVMRCLLDGQASLENTNPAACQRPAMGKQSMFLASGISGGSLGLAGLNAFPQRDKWVDSLRGDYLAPTVSALAFRDVPNMALQANIPDSDRAAALELAWEHAARERGGHLDEGFLASAVSSDGEIKSFPLLELNGTSVADGCRVAVSALHLSSQLGGDEEAEHDGSGNCLSLRVQQLDGRGANLPALAGTKDAFDFSCRSDNGIEPHDIRLSTAALLSARFPYVSPTGALYSCSDENRTFDLDGGLIDSSAASPLSLVWPDVVRWMNARTDDVCYSPKLILIENGYLQETESRPADRPSELSAPLIASMSAQAAATPAARQAAAFEFTKSFSSVGCQPSGARSSEQWKAPNVAHFYPVAQPGVEAPLGWTLSYYSQKSLEHQLGNKNNRCAGDTVAAWFKGPVPEPEACGGPSTP